MNIPTHPLSEGLQTRFEGDAKVIERAWKDETFLSALKADPHTVLSQEFGADIPDSVNITVLEEDATTGYFVIPRNPTELPGTLTLEDLEVVAGGRDTIELPDPPPSCASVIAWSAYCTGCCN